ncbi:MAG: hypothetical protein ACOCPX_02925 [Halapricum sp.]
MSSEHYPDEVEIVETNFKTEQQEDAAETIAEEWPVDLDRLAEEGQHVKMFYKQVLEQFLGPAAEDATFAELKDEYGSLEQWAENGDSEADARDVDVPDIDDIEPGAGESEDGSMDTSVDAAAVESVPDDVDEKRRAWFRAGFREGVEFALENPELFEAE